jgi:hypothetical protein
MGDTHVTLASAISVCLFEVTVSLRAAQVHA